jgi:hypothetical protein
MLIHLGMYLRYCVSVIHLNIDIHFKQVSDAIVCDPPKHIFIAQMSIYQT